MRTADSARTQLPEMQSAVQTGYNSPLVFFLQPEEDAVSSVYDVPSLPCGDSRNLQHHQGEGEKTSDHMSQYDHRALYTAELRNIESGTEGGDEFDFATPVIGLSGTTGPSPLAGPSSGR